MSAEGRTIARNMGWLSISQAVNWVFGLVLTIVQPRYLGVTAMGQLQLGISLWSIIGVLVAFGMDVLLTKETARAPQRVGSLLGTAGALRSLLFAGGCGLVALYARWAGYSADTIVVIAILSLWQFFAQFDNSVRSALQGLERMEFISAAAVVSRFLGAAISIALLLTGHGAASIAAVVAGGAALSCLIQYYFLRRLQPIRIQVDRNMVKWMVQASLPYFLSGVFLIVYAEVSLVVISLLVDETGVGVFGTAYRLLGPFLFLPTIFMSAAFPALARQAVADTGLAMRLMRRSFHLLFLAAVPLGLGILAIAPPVISLLYGPAFAKSGPVLSVLGITLIFLYLNILIGQYLVSVDRQNQWTVVMATATVVRIGLDVLLVPLAQKWLSNGALGAAVVLTTTELGMLMAGLVLLPRGTLNRDSARFAGRTLLAGAGMLLVVLLLRESHIAVPILAGAVTYGLLVLVLRVVSVEDQQLLLLIGRGLLARLRRRLPKPSQVG